MQNSILRRTLLKALPLAASGIVLASRAAKSQDEQSGGTLVVFFSRTGNTQVIARQIARAKTATLVEIVDTGDDLGTIHRSVKLAGD